MKRVVVTAVVARVRAVPMAMAATSWEVEDRLLAQQ